MVHFGHFNRTLPSSHNRPTRLLSADAKELQSARDVQARLFPRQIPKMRNLDCAAYSAPANSVGGDYYDFLDCTPGRLGVAVGDVSGKGVPAALMMAALQASLRSNYAVTDSDLSKRLESVNRLFAETTAVGHYATLVVAEYDDDSGRLRYANCGHLPPILVRCDGRIERLGPTATILGAFERWTCGTGQIRLEAGDTLVLYTDGVTEARASDSREFGEARLIESIRRHVRNDVGALLAGIVQDVRDFAGRATDDLTVLTMRGRTTQRQRAIKRGMS